jgi:hypothetical protein
MALKTRKTLVLCGVSVLRDGAAVQKRLGLGYQGGQQPPAPFSMRHPFPRNPRADTEPEPRRHDVDRPDRDVGVVTRAGRPGCWAGVPVSRKPVLTAGASPEPRVLRMGGTSLTAAGRAGSARAIAAAAGDQARSGRLQTGLATNLRTAGALGWRACSQGGECRTGLPEFSRAGGASTLSTRGEGAE